MKELKQQLVSALLVILTVAAFVAAAINLQQQSKFHLPDDGITWVDRIDKVSGATNLATSRVVAVHVAPASPGEKAGVHRGDQLVSIADLPIPHAMDATMVLARLGAWRKADYKVLHGKTEVVSNVIIGEAERDATLYYQYAVAFIYLSIGLFVYFRRGGAPRGLHFFLLCLGSFVMYAFHYSGKLNNFDKVIYLGNVIAGYLVPALFLHFCLAFPEANELAEGGAIPIRPTRRWFESRLLRASVYVPGLALLTVHLGVVTGWITNDALLEMRWLLDRVWLCFLCGMYLLGAGVLTVHLRRSTAYSAGLEAEVAEANSTDASSGENSTDDAIVRRQLTWLRNGAVAGILPFAAFYVIPYAFGVPPTHLMDLSVLSLVIIPLTWAYAVLRYRLMDVDIIFQEGYVYTLATLAVLGIFYGLIFSLSKTTELSGTTLLALILIAAFVFQPIRNWIQEQMDRHYFYKDRYDYRRTLIEFARELGSPSDLNQMLETVADRLIRTLGIRQIAFFNWHEDTSAFQMAYAGTRNGRRPLPAPDQPHYDLSFLTPNPGKPYLFFERTRNMLDVVSQNDLSPSARHSIADLELTYYLPCNARGRTIAYLGVSRTESGDFLSSDDVELLVTLSGYVGIAIDNATLYRSLERKVEEYEKLKEFSENIVESIHVGILAADLDDRVESWNSQLERLTGISRGRAVGRTLRELLPEELCASLSQARPSREEANGEIQNIYKYVLKPQDMPSAKEKAGKENSPAEFLTSAVTLNIAVAPLFSREGSHIGRLIILEDITDRAELERRLVQADKLSSMGLLAAGVAHEVNTPLAVISTYAQMLAKQIAGDKDKAPLLEKIARQTFRASEIVNSLLNFSRTGTTEFVSMDLNRVIRETVGLVEHQLTKSNVQVELELEENLPRMKGNAGKLQQVFLNLFLNARDAMENGGTLKIRSLSDGGRADGRSDARSGNACVRVTVADTGAGIATENLTRVFDPFYTTKGAKKGTGLGLSVSYGIVQEHGGDIEVDSRLGFGTRFELSFPQQRVAGPKVIKTVPETAQPVPVEVASNGAVAQEHTPPQKPSHAAVGSVN